MPNVSSEIEVKLIGQWGSDRDIAEAAWASSGNSPDGDNPVRVEKLINSLMRDRHGSPFDEGFLSVHIIAPRAVRDEWVRHRNQSYSSSSLRYTLTDGDVYIPSPTRPLIKTEGHKQIRPKYEPLSEEQYAEYNQALIDVYEYAEARSYDLQDKGIDTTEALRWITFDGHYVKFRARAFLRCWLQFLQLRTHRPDANHPSYPMWEIEQAANQVETIIADHWPLVYKAWNENGRDI